MIKNIVIFIIGVIVSCIFLEAYYQITEISLPYHELNPKLGKAMIPSRRITYFEEGFYLGKSNEYGYLGPAYPPEKEKAKVRIALMGDSYTEGFYLFEQHHFSQILEKQLNQEFATPKYEVLNFGIGGYNYNDLAILYKNKTAKFNCDILIFIIGVSDLDFSENFVPTPLLKMEKDSLMIDYSFTNSTTFKYYNRLSFLFDNSCLVKAANNAYKLYNRGDVFNEIIFGKFYTAFQKPTAEESDDIAAPEIDVDERVIKSLKWFEGKKVYFVFRADIPNGLQSALKENNISYTSVLPALENKLTSKGINYRYFDVTNSPNGHWNHAGQIVVAEELYRMLKKDE